ncbi:MAG TPA: hypothetical protein VM848_04250 [Acidimicrobiia bacterium]|nr:hypothetical protein [Acidimicrobiia bacterium]
MRYWLISYLQRLISYLQRKETIKAARTALEDLVQLPELRWLRLTEHGDGAVLTLYERGRR